MGSGRPFPGGPFPSCTIPRTQPERSQNAARTQAGGLLIPLCVYRAAPLPDFTGKGFCPEFFRIPLFRVPAGSQDLFRLQRFSDVSVSGSDISICWCRFAMNFIRDLSHGAYGTRLRTTYTCLYFLRVRVHNKYSTGNDVPRDVRETERGRPQRRVGGEGPTR